VPSTSISVTPDGNIEAQDSHEFWRRQRCFHCWLWMCFFLNKSGLVFYKPLVISSQLITLWYFHCFAGFTCYWIWMWMCFRSIGCYIGSSPLLPSPSTPWFGCYYVFVFMPIHHLNIYGWWYWYVINDLTTHFTSVYS
jgi:hypothetical protein